MSIVGEDLVNHWDEYELEEFNEMYETSDHFLNEFFEFYKRIINGYEIPSRETGEWEFDVENKFLKIIFDKTDKLIIIKHMKNKSIEYKKILKEI